MQLLFPENKGWIQQDLSSLACAKLNPTLTSHWSLLQLHTSPGHRKRRTERPSRQWNPLHSSTAFLCSSLSKGSGSKEYPGRSEKLMPKRRWKHKEAPRAPSQRDRGTKETFGVTTTDTATTEPCLGLPGVLVTSGKAHFSQFLINWVGCQVGLNRRFCH